jgi:hypothetical protein
MVNYILIGLVGLMFATLIFIIVWSIINPYKTQSYISYQNDKKIENYVPDVMSPFGYFSRYNDSAQKLLKFLCSSFKNTIQNFAPPVSSIPVECDGIVIPKKCVIVSFNNSSSTLRLFLNGLIQNNSNTKTYKLYPNSGGFLSIPPCNANVVLNGITYPVRTAGDRSCWIDAEQISATTKSAKKGDCDPGQRDDGVSCWEDLKCNTYWDPCASRSPGWLGGGCVGGAKTECKGCGCIKKTLFQRQYCDEGETMVGTPGGNMCKENCKTGYSEIGVGLCGPQGKANIPVTKEATKGICMRGLPKGVNYCYDCSMISKNVNYITIKDNICYGKEIDIGSGFSNIVYLDDLDSTNVFMQFPPIDITIERFSPPGIIGNCMPFPFELSIECDKNVCGTFTSYLRIQSGKVNMNMKDILLNLQPYWFNIKFDLSLSKIDFRIPLIINSSTDFPSSLNILNSSLMKLDVLLEDAPTGDLSISQLKDSLKTVLNQSVETYLKKLYPDQDNLDNSIDKFKVDTSKPFNDFKSKIDDMHIKGFKFTTGGTDKIVSLLANKIAQSVVLTNFREECFLTGWISDGPLGKYLETGVSPIYDMEPNIDKNIIFKETKIYLVSLILSNIGINTNSVSKSVSNLITNNYTKMQKILLDPNVDISKIIETPPPYREPTPPATPSGLFISIETNYKDAILDVNKPLTDGFNKAIFQGDGNLVIYDKNNIPLWNSGSFSKKPRYAKLDTTGNFSLCEFGKTNSVMDDKKFWSTNTSNFIRNEPYTLKFENCNLRIYDSKSSIIWSTLVLKPNDFIISEAANYPYKLVFQSDGNLVMYDSNNKARWASMSFSPMPKLAVLQNDGNLVLYDYRGNAYWSTNTQGKGVGPYNFKFYGKGIYILDSQGKEIWSATDDTETLIYHKQSEKCVDADGSKLYFNSCDLGNNYQKWQLLPGKSANDFLIQHRLSSKCVDGDGSKLYFNTCNKDNDYQNFSKEDAKPGFFTLKHKASQKCIDGDGTNLYFSNCGGKTNDYQNWQDSKKNLGLSTSMTANNIVHKKTNKCLDGNGSKVYFSNCDKTTNQYQKWEPIRNEKLGTTMIKHTATGKCLDGNGKDLLYIRPCDRFNEYQNFTKEDAQPGFYNYKHKASGKCIDGDGTSLYFMDCDKNNDFQNWN